MILHPGVIALLLSSAVILLLVLVSAGLGWTILRRWDLASGSSRQLTLERRTYLVSTVLSFAFLFQLVSFFLFIATADRLCSLVAGAMCAAGVLQAAPWGYPVLLLKLATFLLAGLWLILNHADLRAPDYPLTRLKYRLLLGIAPLFAAEFALQFLFFAGIVPDVITSCCGSLFGGGGGSEPPAVFALPPGPVMALFFLLAGGAAAAGAIVGFTGKGARALAPLSGAAFLAALAAVPSFIAPYLYELPTHHCPFCLLQREYGFIGYPFYALLLGGTVCGLGAGVMERARRVPSLAGEAPRLRQGLALGAGLGFGLLLLVTLSVVLRSGLVLLARG